MSKVKVWLTMELRRGQVWIEATSLENALRKAGQDEAADDVAKAAERYREQP